MFRKLILVLLLLPLAGWAQFNNNYWVFGDSAGIYWNGSVPSVIYSEIQGRGTTVNLSDSNGMLLSSQTAYTYSVFNTTKTFNKFFLPILGSDSIIGEGWYHEMVIIPVPESDSLAYIFSIGVTIPPNFGLYYTLINYRANNDSGLVIQKNMQLNNAPAFDGLAAIRHGNGRDWWLVFQRWDNAGIIQYNDFFSYKISSSGITTNLTQNLGPSHTTGGGQFLFNTSGNKCLNLSWRGLLCLYDFDRCTGLLSNPLTIEQERSAAPYPYYVSGVFSPDDSKIYLAAYTHPNGINFVDTLYQFDLDATNIAQSKLAIYSAANADIGLAAMKLAPDNKIYLTTVDLSASIPYPDSLYTQFNTNLSVINQPDSLGLACDFQPFSFYLGGARTYYGLPNNPDYELGAWVGSPCDTLSVGVQHPEPTETLQPFLQAWYNHGWDMIHVNASKLQGKKGVLRLVDIEGRIVFEKPAEVISGGYFTTEIYTHEISDGVYVVHLVTDRETWSFKVGKL